jgi:pimeloyl-[acyl-carrier protein] methyl ester esterase
MENERDVEEPGHRVTAPTTVLLPGLDGTAKLFEPFVAIAPARFRVQPRSLPNERPRSYRELADWILPDLPPTPIALIAESFSGPLALLLADRCSRVIAVVLCASFVEPPLPRFIARLPAVLWTRPPPTAFLRLFLTGGDGVLAEEVRTAMATARAGVIANRIASVLSVDVVAELQRLSAPLLFLEAAQDRIIGSRSARRARILKPSASYASVRSPHLLLQTHPEDAWRQIEPFFDSALFPAALRS